MTLEIFVPSVPVVTVECFEPEGKVTRSIYPMILSPDNLKTFWEKSKPFRTLFSDEVNGDFKKFLELFLTTDEEYSYVTANGLFWVIDDFVGVYYMTNITETEADVHYTFFDRRHTGRELLTRAMLKYVFGKYYFRRLNVNIPLYASKHAFAFVEHLGFVREGRKRKAVRYKNDWFDVACYGLLREEI